MKAPNRECSPRVLANRTACGLPWHPCHSVRRLTIPKLTGIDKPRNSGKRNVRRQPVRPTGPLQSVKVVNNTEVDLR